MRIEPFPFQEKLMLNSHNLSAADIPLKDLFGTALGASLHKLSLQVNRLGTVPVRLVNSLPMLRTLDLSQCELNQLPKKWNLPKLTHLYLNTNRLTDFPEEVSIALCACDQLMALCMLMAHTVFLCNCR